MRKKIEISAVIVTVLFISALFGCLMDNESELTRSEIESGQEASGGTDLALAPDIVDERISLLGTYLERKDISNKNRETAESLLDSYGKIRTTLDSPVSKEYYKGINHILFDGMIMLEEKSLNLKINEGIEKKEMREPENDGPPQERIAGTVLPIDLLDVKIAMFEEYLERKNISIEDRETARILLSRYKKISIINKTAESEEDYREMTQIHLDTMIMVEERTIGL